MRIETRGKLAWAFIRSRRSFMMRGRGTGSGDPGVRARRRSLMQNGSGSFSQWHAPKLAASGVR